MINMPLKWQHIRICKKNCKKIDVLMNIEDFGSFILISI
jgi:hypothetical protein